MPYKKREPVSELEMNRTGYEGHHSICQFLRDMYHLMETPDTNKEEIRIKIRVAMAMAKAMNDKIQWYKHRDQGILPGG